MHNSKSKSLQVTRQKQKALAKKLFAGLLIAIVSISGIGLLTFQWFGKRITKDTQENLLIIANLKADQIRQWIQERKADGQILAGQPSVINLLRAIENKNQNAIAQAKPILSEVVNNNKNGYGYIRIVLLNQLGIGVWDFGQGADLPSEISTIFQDKFHPFAKIDRKINQTELVDLHWRKTPTGKSLVYGVIAPVYDYLNPSSPFLGAVYMEVDPSKYLFSIFQDQQKNFLTAETFLFRREGNIVRYLTPLKHQNITPLEFTKSTNERDILAVQTLSTKEALLRGIDYRGVSVIGAVKGVPDTPWSMISKMDKSEADAPLNQLAIVIGGLTTLFIAIVLYIARQLWRTSELALFASQQQAEVTFATIIEQSARRYIAAIETSMDGYALLDRQGKFRQINDSLVLITGYSAEELLNLSIFDLVVDNSDEMLNFMGNSIPTSRQRIIQQWQHRDRHIMDVEIGISYFEEEDQFFTFIQDITHNLQTQRQLERSTQLHSFLSRANEAIVRTREPQILLSRICEIAIAQGNFSLAWIGIPNADTQMVEVAAAAGSAMPYLENIQVSINPDLEISRGPTGTAIRELRSVIVNDYLAESITAPWHAIALENGINSCATIPLRIDRQTVGAIMFYASAINYFTDDVMTLLTELTEDLALALALADSEQRRAEAEASLYKSEERFRLAIINAPFPIILYTEVNEALQINRAWIEQAGFGDRDIQEITQWTEQFCQEHLSKIRASGNHWQDSNQTEYEATITDCHGSQRIWRFASAPLPNHLDGDVVNIAIAMDVTDHKANELALKKAKEQAEEANQAKSVFLASMSHELRTPLNGILGYAQIFLIDPDFTEQQKEGFQIIYQCGSHLLNLISEILDLSKIEAHKIELCPTEIEFSNFLMGVAQMCRIKAEEKNLLFQCDVSEQLPFGVVVDEQRLRQVLLNLLGNAIKFTDSGVVTMSVKKLPRNPNDLSEPTNPNVKNIRFLITDTGKGIASEHLEKIFLPFEQVGDRQDRPEGAGLGLAISQKLVAMMGSTLHVESEVNRGSRFWFDLELLDISSTVINHDSFNRTQRIIGYEGTRRTILVADDTWVNRNVIAKLLESWGFIVLEAVNGHDGISMVTSNRVDAIITDLIMPVLDGFAMTQFLRELPDFPPIPIIAISASVGKESQTRSLESGCTDFLCKPIDASALLEKLTKHLQLTWIYDNQSLELQPLDAQVNSQVDSQIDSQSLNSHDQIMPPLPELQLIENALEIGDFDTIEQISNRIRLLDPQYQWFSDKLVKFVQAFDEKSIIHLLRSGDRGKEP